MNRDLEALILAYEATSEARDAEARQKMEEFEALLDPVLERHPGLSRDSLRKSVIRAHRKWALNQERKPPYIPPGT
jgi:hypothetical protein